MQDRLATAARRWLRPSYRFSWVVPDRLGGMGSPHLRERWLWRSLSRKGVALVVSLTVDAPDPAVLSRFSLDQLHLPIPDFSPPTMIQVETLVAAYRRKTAEGKGVVVHCGAGLGRTGTMLAMILVADGSDAAQAIARVRACRPGSIETRGQEASIEEFANRLEQCR